MLRKLKLTYILYNIFNKRKLTHNLKLYKKLGLKKFYFSPISSKDFKNLDKNLLNESGAVCNLADTKLFKNIDERSQQSLLGFEQEGYAILNQHLPKDTINAINTEIENLLAQKKVSFNNANKIMFAIHQSNFLKSIGEDENLLALLSSIMGEEVKLFQSINFKMGSEQHTHSDSIHMTTFPLGGLLGVWIALEDIELDNGPLQYFPGSHKLPYYLNQDYNNEGNAFLLGSKTYSAYEAMIEEKLQEYSQKKQVFTAKAGDVLIWHANLFHGGEPHLNKAKTRKSMVLHYFAPNRICYHEITQRPALMG
ncbi:phytanoyl-CoA dioxygenase family protein [Pedobacter arcticus]|uniref:phytanoyl-CoA dioxygenase family protein n=1 Tax=Pedobacter arcticus TaxID=752140 RepID=UPI0002FF3C75|nr:phytanoyl-CoA dioxygenase family protein [Pedobacter arcticus]